MAGPFPIVEQVGNAYRLDLLHSIKVHPVFAPEKLRRAAEDPLPGQIVEPALPINVDGEEEWEVEEILASKKRWKSLYYRVS